MLSTQYEIVVSTENSPYMVWQAMLFHWSCVTYLGRPPVVMVHTDEWPLLEGFERIRQAGGIVQTAPNYRMVAGVEYPPRNTAGSLRHVETDADYIVLCDPDLLCLQPIPFEQLALQGRQVSFDFVGYLDPDLEVYQPSLDGVCRSAGISPQRLRQPAANGGVPHVIPVALQQELSDEWLELMEHFPNVETNAEQESQRPQKEWLTTMWALLMAVCRLELEPVLTHLCLTNCYGDRPLPPLDAAGPKLLHYCYDSPGFSKRQFENPAGAAQAVWQAAPADGSISGEIRRQIRTAREYYGLEFL